MNDNNFTDRLSKCYTGVIHDIMRDDGHKNFTLPPSIRPSKDKHVLAGQIFTMEGFVDQTLDQMFDQTCLIFSTIAGRLPWQVAA